VPTRNFRLVDRRSGVQSSTGTTTSNTWLTSYTGLSPRSPLNSTSFCAVASATVTYNSPLQVTSCAAQFLEFMSIVSSSLYTAACLAFFPNCQFLSFRFITQHCRNRTRIFDSVIHKCIIIIIRNDLPTELRVSRESHSGSVPPQPLNKRKTEKYPKTNDCSFLNSFIGMLRMLRFSRQPADGGYSSRGSVDQAAGQPEARCDLNVARLIDLMLPISFKPLLKYLRRCSLVNFGKFLERKRDGYAHNIGINGL
jgi:hypothetical protein